MTNKTVLNVVTATKFSSSDYEKLKYFATAKGLNISTVEKQLKLLINYQNKQISYGSFYHLSLFRIHLIQ